MNVAIRSRSDVLLRCPYCFDSVDGVACTWQCARCSIALHAECGAELGRCPVLGCTAVKRILLRQAPWYRRLDGSLRWSLLLPLLILLLALLLLAAVVVFAEGSAIAPFTYTTF